MEEVDTMPSNSQEFCLRWNNFHSSLVSALDGFKNDLDFVDVTLACEGQFLKAHKMLLSACSVFFRDLLKANPCQHPIVILPPEVRFIDLEKMLRFIYQGEVNVHQENLARFLKTAEMLKIRGLAEDNEKQKVLQATSPRPPENSSCGGDRGNSSSSVSPKRPRLSIDTQSGSLTDHPHTPIDENSHLSGGDSDSEMIPVKQEMIELKECDFDNADDSFLTETYLRENVSGTCSNNTSNSQSLPTHPAAPPPPGPLLPSYVPPPQIKAQDDSPVGATCQEDVSQGVDDGAPTESEPRLHLPLPQQSTYHQSTQVQPTLNEGEIKQEIEIKEEDSCLPDGFSSSAVFSTSIGGRATNDVIGVHRLSYKSSFGYESDDTESLEISLSDSPASPSCGMFTTDSKTSVSGLMYRKCPVCHKNITYNHLRRHIRTQHTVMEAVKCPHCSRILKNTYSLETHLSNYHHNVKPSTL